MRSLSLQVMRGGAPPPRLRRPKGALLHKLRHPKASLLTGVQKTPSKNLYSKTASVGLLILNVRKITGAEVEILMRNVSPSGGFSGK